MNKIITYLFIAFITSMTLSAQLVLNSGLRNAQNYLSPYWFPFQNQNKSNLSQPQPLVLGNGNLMIVYATNSIQDTITTRTSSDGGLSWSSPNIVATVSKNSQAAYLGLSGIVTNTNRIILSYSLIDNTPSSTKMFKSDDNGVTWSAITYMQSSVCAISPSFAKLSGGKIFFMTGLSTYYYSTDDGVHWGAKNSSVAFQSLVQTDSLNLLAFYCQYDIYNNSQIFSKKSTDGGVSWTNYLAVATDSQSSERPRVIKDNSGTLWLFYTVKKSTNFNEIYQCDIYYKTSTDNGNTWSGSNQFTKYTGQDLDMNIALLNNQPYVVFMSDRWYGNRQIWGAKIGITSDDNVPPTLYSCWGGERDSSIVLIAYCGSSFGLSSVKASYKLNGLPQPAVTMYDDGLHNDYSANDDIYGVTLSGCSANDIIIYKFIITDKNSNTVTINGGSVEMPYTLIKRYECMSAGLLHNWYSSMGCENEEGRVKEQQDGLLWPGLYPNQDMQVSKGLWIGSTNFTDNDGNYYLFKVVHIGPRVTGEGEVYPVKFQVINRFATPLIYINGTQSNQYPVYYDSIAPNMKADRMIVNEVNTQLGVTMRRKIFQFSHPQHDNYIVTEYTFTNTGNTNGNSTIELPDNTITGLRVFFLNKYAVCKETRYVIGNGSGWGMNTMLDARGDGVRPDTITEHYRTQFGWHGYWPSKVVTYNNIGGPIWLPGSQYGQQSDTVGRLGATQFVGQLVLYADQSSNNHNDDFSQPSTTSFVSSDLMLLSGNNPYNIEQMTEEYELMSTGHSSPRHAWVVQPNGDFALQTNPPEMGTSGGFSACNGFGPYTLAHADSVKFVLVEGVAGLSREECIRIGKEYKNGSMDDVTKNRLVLTGKDSLMKTWKMATENYQSNYNLPALPLPPKEVHITSQNTTINLTWQLFENSNPSNVYRIYRRYVKADSTFRMIYEGPSSVLSYEDNNLRLGTQYSYYIVTVDGNGLTSNPAYTYSPVTVSTLNSVKSESETIKSYSLLQNFPNPFNPETNIKYNLPSGGNVRLTVYNSLGQKVKELVNSYKEAGSYEVKFSGKELASGMYIYKLDAVSKDGKKSFSSSRKMLLVK